MTGQVSRMDTLANGRPYLQSVNPEDPIPYHQFALRLTPQTEEITSAGFRAASELYACDDPRPKIRAQFDYIRLTSDVDFDAAHPAGSDLSDIFRLGFLSYLSDQKAGDIPLESVRGYYVPFDYFLYTEIPPVDLSLDRRFFVEVSQVEQSSQEQIFTVQTAFVKFTE